MTIEKLKELAEHSFEYGLGQLREKGDLAMMFHLVLRGGGIEIVVCDAGISNSEDAKRWLAGKIRGRIAAGEIVAVIMLTDSFFAQNITPEANRIRLAFGMTIEQAAAAGLCEKREAVIGRLESPIYWLHLMQEYERVDGRIEMKGEVIRTGSEDGGPNLKGRFSNFFGDGAASGARQ